jgi:cytochrome c-type biogenesis protein
VEAKIPLAFVAGLVSFATPCVLPLVPGYLAVVSGQEAGVTGRRVVLASLPFVAGFTAVFVALGAAVAYAGSLFPDHKDLFLAVAGLVVVVLGFAMMGLLPLPYLDRLAAPGLVQSASNTGSAALLGGAFGLCAAPCIGPVLGGILALAGEGQTVAEGTILLLIYSAGLALPFLAVGIGFGRAMTASRWLRDHYPVLRVVGGAMLVALGLLLFFDRFWWLSVAVNRFFEFFGIGV